VHPSIQPSFALLAALAILTSTAGAQDRTTSRRARLELSFDHGYGFSTEGSFIELAADLRLLSPDGIGVALRTGSAVQGLSNAHVIELGIAGRLNLFSLPHVGLQLGGAIGPSLACGPFDGGDVRAYGGWASLHLDLWHRNLFVGVGVSGHALLSDRHATQIDPLSIEAPRGDAPILSLTPLIRLGGDWGL